MSTTLPDIKIKSRPRITHPPIVEVDGREIPGVVGVMLEHPPRQFAYVTLTVATDDYKLKADGLTSDWKVEQVRRRHMKRRAKRVFI